MSIFTLIAQPANLGSEGIQPVSPLGAEAATDPTGQLEIIVSTALGLLTVVAGIFFIIYFFLAALKWLTAGGDSGKVEKARDEMMQGVIGLVIIVAAYGIIGLVSTILGLDILNPGAQIEGIVETLGGGAPSAPPTNLPFTIP